MNKNNNYVGVDEKYIPEDEKNIDESSNNKRNKILRRAGIGYIIIISLIVIIAIIIFIFIFSNFIKIKDNANNQSENIQDQIKNDNELIDSYLDKINS